MNAAINNTMGLREWSMLLILSILWGSSFFFVEVVVTELPPLSIVFSRVLLAATALWIFAWLAGLRPPAEIRIWRSFLVMGTVNNVIPFCLIVWGQAHIASGLAAILNASTPLFTVVVAGLWLSDEGITLRKFAGVLTGFCGVVVMIAPDVTGGYGDNLLAQFAILGAAFSYAVAGVYGRRFKAMELNPVVTAAGQVSASAVILLPMVLLLEAPQELTLPGFHGLAALLALGLLSTALAYILYFRILASAGATNLLLVAFLIPISAILLGTSLLGESLGVIHYSGMTMIGLGLLLIDGRLLKFGYRTRPQSG